MKKYILVTILGVLLFGMVGCAQENVKKREETIKITPSEGARGTTTPTPKPTKTPTPTPTNTPKPKPTNTPTPKPTLTPTPLISVFHYDIRQIRPEKVELVDKLKEAWGTPEYSGAFINIRESMVAVWKEKEDWLSSPSGMPWQNVCDVLQTDWDNCEFYIFVYGFEDAELGGWAYMKVTKEQFIAYVNCLTVDEVHWAETGEVIYEGKFRASIWLQDGKIIRIAEAYIG